MNKIKKIMNKIKNFILKYKVAIGACVLMAAFGFGYWVLGNPGTTTIGENVSVGGNLSIGETEVITSARVLQNVTASAGIITSGTLDGDRLPAISTTKKGGVPATGTPAGKYLKDDGTWATAGGTSYTLVATLASDQATGADTTPVSLSGLVFNYEANSTYRIWFMGRVSPAAAGTGCGFQFDLSSAVTDINVEFFHQLANTGTLSGGHSIADDASVGVSSGMPGTSTYPVFGTGILRTTDNAGTAQLRFRSETTAVTTAKAGMTLVVEKIAG
jgi:hypothetical protein